MGDLNKGPLHPLTGARGLPTLGHIRGNLHFFGNCFRVFVKQKVKQVSRDLVLVVNGANRNRQAVEGAVDGNRDGQHSFSVFADSFFFEGKLGAFGSTGNSNFTGAYFEGHIAIPPANNETLLFGGENSG